MAPHPLHAPLQPELALLRPGFRSASPRDRRNAAVGERSRRRLRPQLADSHDAGVRRPDLNGRAGRAAGRVRANVRADALRGARHAARTPAAPDSSRARSPARADPRPRRRRRLARGFRALGTGRFRSARRRVPDRPRSDPRRARGADHLRLVLHRSPDDALGPGGADAENDRRRRTCPGARDARVAGADLPRLRPSVPADDRWNGALDARPGAEARGAEARGHVPDDAALGRRRTSRSSRRASRWSCRTPPRLRHEQTDVRPAAQIRPRRCAPPRAPRPRVRRRAHGGIPVLPPSCDRRFAPPRRVSHRRRLARGVDAQLLATVCRHSPRDDRVARPARMRAARLVAEGYRDQPIVLPGEYAGPIEVRRAEEVDPSLVVYAGRHVKEKRVGALVQGFAQAGRRRPDLRLEIYGDGPERRQVEALVRELELTQRVIVAGHRPEDEVAAAFERAACVATASEREGYGLVDVEAAARGTPSVVVAGPENAATELVREGMNGAVARDASPEELAGALLRVVDGGPSLRSSTSRGFAENADMLSLQGSLEVVLRSYAETPEPRRPRRVASR